MNLRCRRIPNNLYGSFALEDVDHNLPFLNGGLCVAHLFYRLQCREEKIRIYSRETWQTLA